MVGKRRKKASEILRALSVIFKAQFFTADEGRKMRCHAIKQIDLAIEELWRDRKKLQTAAQTRVYMTIGYLARVRDAILTNTELSEIYGRLEESEKMAEEVEAVKKYDI